MIRVIWVLDPDPDYPKGTHPKTPKNRGKKGQNRKTANPNVPLISCTFNPFSIDDGRWEGWGEERVCTGFKHTQLLQYTSSTQSYFTFFIKIVRKHIVEGLCLHSNIAFKSMFFGIRIKYWTFLKTILHVFDCLQVIF